MTTSPGDHLEVTQIFGQDGVALLDRCGGDHQIVERQHVTLGRFLPLDLPHQEGRLTRHRMDRHQVSQFFAG
jgi:hypothetical protein